VKIFDVRFGLKNPGGQKPPGVKSSFFTLILESVNNEDLTPRFSPLAFPPCQLHVLLGRTLPKVMTQSLLGINASHLQHGRTPLGPAGEVQAGS
jgi:hypothetical protein